MPYNNCLRSDDKYRPLLAPKVAFQSSLILWPILSSASSVNLELVFSSKSFTFAWEDENILLWLKSEPSSSNITQLKTYRFSSVTKSQNVFQLDWQNYVFKNPSMHLPPRRDILPFGHFRCTLSHCDGHPMGSENPPSHPSQSRGTVTHLSAPRSLSAPPHSARSSRSSRSTSYTLCPWQIFRCYK